MWTLHLPPVGHSTLPWVQNKVCGKTKNNCLQPPGLNAENWSGSCSLYKINRATLCFSIILRDLYLDDRTPTGALHFSFSSYNPFISPGPFDLNTNCNIPVVGVDDTIPSGLHSARHWNNVQPTALAPSQHPEAKSSFPCLKSFCSCILDHAPEYNCVNLLLSYPVWFYGSSSIHSHKVTNSHFSVVRILHSSYF